jgi:hypothetical protein
LQNAVNGVVYVYTHLLLLMCHAFYIEGYNNRI